MKKSIILILLFSVLMMSLASAACIKLNTSAVKQFYNATSASCVEVRNVTSGIYLANKTYSGHFNVTYYNKTVCPQGGLNKPCYNTTAGQVFQFNEYVATCYYINENHKPSSGKTCFNKGFYPLKDADVNGVVNIANSNVELDCHNASIYGLNRGITRTGFPVNVTIKNCRILNYSVGIYADGMNKWFIYNNYINASSHGIYASIKNTSIHDNIIISNRGDGGRYPIYLYKYNGQGNNSIYNNSIYGGTSNIIIEDNINNTRIYNNKLYYNLASSTSLWIKNNTFNNKVYNNRVFNSSWSCYGIGHVNANKKTTSIKFNNNTGKDCFHHFLDITNTDGAIIENNTQTGYVSAGMNIINMTNSKIARNTFNSANVYGAYLQQNTQKNNISFNSFNNVGYTFGLFYLAVPNNFINNTFTNFNYSFNSANGTAIVRHTNTREIIEFSNNINTRMYLLYSGNKVYNLSNRTIKITSLPTFSTYLNSTGAVKKDVTGTITETIAAGKNSEIIGRAAATDPFPIARTETAIITEWSYGGNVLVFTVSGAGNVTINMSKWTKYTILTGGPGGSVHSTGSASSYDFTAGTWGIQSYTGLGGGGASTTACMNSIEQSITGITSIVSYAGLMILIMVFGFIIPNIEKFREGGFSILGIDFLSGKSILSVGIAIVLTVVMVIILNGIQNTLC